MEIVDWELDITREPIECTTPILGGPCFYCGQVVAAYHRGFHPADTVAYNGTVETIGEMQPDDCVLTCGGERLDLSGLRIGAGESIGNGRYRYSITGTKVCPTGDDDATDDDG